MILASFRGLALKGQHTPKKGCSPFEELTTNHIIHATSPERAA